MQAHFGPHFIKFRLCEICSDKEMKIQEISAWRHKTLAPFIVLLGRYHKVFLFCFFASDFLYLFKLLLILF